MGLGTLSLPALAAGYTQPETKPAEEKSTMESLGNGFTLELMCKGDLFLGIGKVAAEDTVLRSNRLPMFVSINTPDAVELLNFRIVNKSVSGEGIRLDFQMQKKEGGLMEWMLHTVRNRRNLAGWNHEPEDAADTQLILLIEPVKRNIGKTPAIGFSYQYLYKSESLPIYKITDRSSWEIGGVASGNELWMRNGVVDSIFTFSDPGDFYSTEWYLPGIANPNIFQFHPLQTQLQGFTFTSAKQGTLISWATKVAHIRSLFEKWRNCHEIMHFHEHCNDLAFEFATSPVEMLWVPGELDPVGRANLYNDMRELVHEELHRQIGMKRERVTTYGVIEEWLEPDFERYAKAGLPKLLNAGVKTVFIPSQCQNDMNTWGLENMCCNVDYKISETVGEEKLAAFCRLAKAGGTRVEMWGNTAISTITERFMHHQGRAKGIKFLPYTGSIMEVIDKAEAPFIRNPSNAIEADHYTPRFCALNLRDKDIHDYWMKQWKYFHDEIGIEGIFLDSSFNMSSDKFHHAQSDGDKRTKGGIPDRKPQQDKYRPEHEPPKSIQTQYHAHLEWVVEMQQMGYRYCGEDMGVFGINRSGPELKDRLDSLPVWADSFCDFREKTVKEAGLESLDVFFKGLAYRMMWKIYWIIDEDRIETGIDDPDALLLIRIYNRVEEFLFNRNILQGELGVTYSKDDKMVLWSFTGFTYPLEGSWKINDLIRNISYRSNQIEAQKNHVYLIEIG